MSVLIEHLTRHGLQYSLFRATARFWLPHAVALLPYAPSILPRAPPAAAPSSTTAPSRATLLPFTTWNGSLRSLIWAVHTTYITYILSYGDVYIEIYLFGNHVETSAMWTVFEWAWVQIINYSSSQFDMSSPARGSPSPAKGFLYAVNVRV